MVERDKPRVVVLAGPNGAGKTTSAKHLLLGPFSVTEFVNADTIAAGLSAFAPDSAAIQAGRVMLSRLDELAKQGVSFAFETTLATRSYKRRLSRMQADGYHVALVFLWLPSPEMAIARVAGRVAAGGHGIPEATIRRRYQAGLSNLRHLYMPLADSWRLIDNTAAEAPRVIASCERDEPAEVFLQAPWQAIMATGNNKGENDDQ